jgi:hypothetical protein
MFKSAIILAAIVTGFGLMGCSSMPASLLPTSLMTTGALPSLASTPAATAKPIAFAKPVKAAKATRMYVWAGFKEKDCSPIAPQMAVAVTPTKGDVTFRPNETITIQHSASGKCVGKRVPGTAIYYTPKADQDGPDRFTVTATSSSGQVATRSFSVNVVQ